MEINKQYRVGIKKMCNFLERLTYAYLTNKTIDKTAITNFGWYIESIVNHSRVAK